MIVFNLYVITYVASHIWFATLGGAPDEFSICIIQNTAA